MGWMVNATPRPLYFQERSGTHCIGGWVDSRAGLVGCGKSRSHRDFFSFKIYIYFQFQYTFYIFPYILFCVSSYSLALHFILVVCVPSLLTFTTCSRTVIHGVSFVHSWVTDFQPTPLYLLCHSIYIFHFHSVLPSLVPVALLINSIPGPSTP
jgi:hypothetical protein